MVQEEKRKACPGSPRLLRQAYIQSPQRKLRRACTHSAQARVSTCTHHSCISCIFPLLGCCSCLGPSLCCSRLCALVRCCRACACTVHPTESKQSGVTIQIGLQLTAHSVE